MSIYTPYTYLIGWSEHQKFYYGVRTAKRFCSLYDSGCHPDDLWKTYFTSSKHVKMFREKYGEPDIIQIRKTFEDAKSAQLWEHNFLKKIRKYNMWKKFLNITSSHSIDINDLSRWNNGVKNTLSLECPGDDWVKGWILYDETKEKLSKAGKKKIGNLNGFYGKKHSDKTKLKLSESKSGDKNPFYGKKRPEHAIKVSKKLKNVPKTFEHKKAIAETHNKTYTCPHCLKSGGRIMLRWHFDKCKSRLINDLN
jgi:hypothetical protein